MARSSTVPKIDSKQSSDQSSGSTTSTEGKNNNPGTTNVIFDWNSSKLFFKDY